MKLIVITSENEAPMDRETLELADKLAGEDYQIDRLIWESEESDAVKALYDVYQSPTVILTANDGSLIELWQGEIPTEAEIKYRSFGA